MSNVKKITGMRLFLPIFCMVLVMAVNILYDVASGNFALNFFTISVRNGVLYGRLIDILKPSNKTVEALTSLQLPAGVEIEIKL